MQTSIALVLSTLATLANGQTVPTRPSNNHCIDMPRRVVQCPFLAKTGHGTLSLDSPRSIDGTCNSPTNPHNGATHTPLLRAMRQAYPYEAADEVSEGRGSARTVSNRVMNQKKSKPSRRLTSMAWVWGQFLDHDMVRTMESEHAMPVPLRGNDPFLQIEDDNVIRRFPKGQHKLRVSEKKVRGELAFNRTLTMCPSTAALINDPSRSSAQQFNNISSFIDASNVYSSDPNTAHDVRAFTHGLLKMSEEAMLPYDENTFDDPDGPFYLAGDDRSNEHTGLTAMHVLWVREHNRIAHSLADANVPCEGECDEKTYQQARKRVIALMQHITYTQYLPALLGPHELPEYTGYKPDIDASISNVFGTAAYRFGHSMVNSQLLRLEKDMQTSIPAGPLSLVDSFFKPALLRDPSLGGVAPILRGLVVQPAEEIDVQVIDELRNSLFNSSDDLCTRNVQRGRDHSLPTFQAARRQIGLAPLRDFTDIPDQKVRKKFQKAYKDVEDIDLFVGGLAEPHYGKGNLGETFHHIIRDQFLRLRDGDRYWYEQDPELVAFVDGVYLRDVIARNVDGISRKDMRKDVFLVRKYPKPPTGAEEETATN